MFQLRVLASNETTHAILLQDLVSRCRLTARLTILPLWPI